MKSEEGNIGIGTDQDGKCVLAFRDLCHVSGSLETQLYARTDGVRIDQKGDEMTKKDFITIANILIAIKQNAEIENDIDVVIEDFINGLRNSCSNFDKNKFVKYMMSRMK